MALPDLPEEILIIITRMLDLQTIWSLYSTCSRLKEFVCLTTRVFDASLSDLSTALVLKQNFFRDVARNLKELNLMAVRDLTKSALKPALKNLPNLTTLNVSWTKITLPDLKWICKSCPNIKNITINFIFDDGITAKSVAQTTITSLENLFQQFNEIEFVGTFQNLIASALPLLLLKNTTDLTVVKLTVAKSINHPVITTPVLFIRQMFTCKELIVHEMRMPRLCVFNFDYIEIEEVKYIIISKNCEINVVASPDFDDFFFENFCVRPSRLQFLGNVTGRLFMFYWREAFDKKFFDALYVKLKPFCPIRLEHAKSKDFPKHCHNFYSHINNLNEGATEVKKCPPFAIKKRKLFPPVHELNFEDALKDVKNIELSVFFFCDGFVTLPRNSSYLQNVIYISLSGKVSYNIDFFTILFKSCKKLVTFNIDQMALSMNLVYITNSLQYSSSLKNFRLVHKNIDFNNMFSNLIKCRALENVRVCDIGIEKSDLTKLKDVIKKCPKLYSIVIETFIENSVRNRLLAEIKNIKSIERTPFINCEIIANRIDYSSFDHDPYDNVFNRLNS